MTKDNIENKSVEDSSSASYSLENNGERDERKIRSARALQFESIRLATFHYFKYKNTVNINRLAKRGFFYNRRSDTVCCLFCPTELQNSNNYEEPSTHARDDDKCKMTIFPLNGNVPLVEKYVQEDYQSKLNDMLQDLMNYKVKSSYLYKETIIDFYSGFTGNEDFSKYDVRLSTFDNWFKYLPTDKIPNKERYAEAGFVYTGFSDIVMCFNCKGGFFNIDKDDDPIKDHARYYGHCSFMVDSFHGKGFVSEWGFSGVPGMMFADMPLIIHPLIQNLIIVQGYEKKIISKWIYDYVKIYGCYPLDIESCITEVEKSMKENKKRMEEKKSMEEELESTDEEEKSMLEKEKSMEEKEKSMLEKEKCLEEEEELVEEEKKLVEEEEKRVEEEEKRVEEEKKLVEEEEKRVEEEKSMVEKEKIVGKEEKSMEEKKSIEK